MKKDEEEREKANQLKIQKKLEREQKRLLNEQKRKQEEQALHSSEEESLLPNNFKSSSNKLNQHKSSKTQIFFVRINPYNFYL